MDLQDSMTLERQVLKILVNIPAPWSIWANYEFNLPFSTIHYFSPFATNMSFQVKPQLLTLCWFALFVVPCSNPSDQKFVGPSTAGFDERTLHTTPNYTVKNEHWMTIVPFCGFLSLWQAFHLHPCLWQWSTADVGRSMIFKYRLSMTFGILERVG